MSRSCRYLGTDGRVYMDRMVVVPARRSRSGAVRPTMNGGPPKERARESEPPPVPDNVVSRAGRCHRRPVQAVCPGRTGGAGRPGRPSDPADRVHPGAGHGRCLHRAGRDHRLSHLERRRRRRRRADARDGEDLPRRHQGARRRPDDRHPREHAPPRRPHGRQSGVQVVGEDDPRPRQRARAAARGGRAPGGPRDRTRRRRRSWWPTPRSWVRGARTWAAR